ncbi:zinc transporter 9 [Trichonephila clavipes]|nr:zinc transporter 9 [Trichonephila clavipes]
MNRLTPQRFVEWAQNEIAVVPDFHKRILFSDEAHFWLNGYVNKKNCRIWSEANPQVYVETLLHPEKLTVWCALWAGGIIGPYFFKNNEGHNVTVNGDWYRAMITNFFIPELNNHDVQELWFQQDSATCHTARATIDLLKDTLGDHLISRFGPVNWRPRSCDSTLLDYFLGGYVKSLVYADKPQMLDHLEDNIRRVIADIQPQMLEKVIENWTSRLDYIRASHGITFPVCSCWCFSLQRNFHLADIYFVKETTEENKVSTAAQEFNAQSITKDDKQKNAAKSLSTKRKEERKKMDYTKSFTERNFITPLRAMNEYLLKPGDLEKLRKITRRSPFEDNPPIHVYLRRDVEQKSIEIWGSQEALQRELKRRQDEEEQYRNSIFHVKKILKDYTRSTMHEEERKRQEYILRTSGKVVMTAVIINSTNFALKVIAWLYTGSHSMFAEAIHSLADTGNQLLLVYGLKKSLQTPTQYHPYGYHNMRYVASLISGVGIFFLGTGLSLYHGINGILNPEQMESLYWAYVVLGGSLMSEGGTLAMAFRETARGAKRDGMTFLQYASAHAENEGVNELLRHCCPFVLQRQSKLPNRYWW